MRKFEGILITHNLSKSERYIEQKRLKSYLRGDDRFRYKNRTYQTTPKPISSNPQDDLLPQITI